MMFLQFLTNIQNDSLKKWNFKVKSNSQEIAQKLKETFQSSSGFVFNIDQHKNNSINFKVHKPIKYPDQILHRNRIVVNGKILNTDAKNEADVQIDFHQHFYMKLTVFSVIATVVILLILISRYISGSPMFVLGGILIGISTGLWLALKKTFENYILEYKTLISDVLKE